MLRFLVLGLVPGTTVQLTLADILLTFLLIVAAFQLFTLHRQHPAVNKDGKVTKKTPAKLKKATR